MPNAPWELFNKSTGTVTTSVKSSATDVQVLAPNTARKMYTVFNDSTQVLYLMFGSLAANGASSTTNYTVQIASNGYYESPVNMLYLGEVRGIWASANGNARVTEFV